ncbi:MAG TPA: patatin-like phospholipase family protein [Acetobacteraceae bacterium]
MSWTTSVGVVAVLGFRDIPARFLLVYIIGSAVLVYSIFSWFGVFSVFDAVGWFAPTGGPSDDAGNRRSDPARVIRIPADRGARARNGGIGVVLAGGGGKGAYQIGCWKAMQRHGLKVDAVAGTSVGALNAAMIARGDPALAEDVWRHLSASQLMRLDVVALLFAPLTYARYRRRYQGDLPTPGVLLVIAAAVALTLCLAWYLQAQIRLAVSAEHPGSLSWLVIFCWIGVLVVYLARLLLALAMVVPSRLRIPAAPAVFHTASLQRLVRQIAPAGTFSASSCKCFVTTAEQQLLFDRDDPLHDRGAAHRRRTGRRFEPRIVYPPFYWPLHRAEADVGITAARILLGLSAALPILFTPVRIKTTWHFDGALADRLPIRPLLDHGCGLIFVIHLDATGQDMLDGRHFNVLTRDGLVAKLEWQARLRRLARDFTPAHDAAVQQHGLDALAETRPTQDAAPLASEIIHVVPSRDLGSFLTGTMNFTGRKARWLIDLGERDMTEVLQALDRGQKRN